MKKTVTSWSFSRYSDYRQCPAKFKYKVIDRLQEPSNAAMERGTKIHTLAEQYIKSELRRLPIELDKFKALFTMLRALYKKKIRTMDVESTWAFTKTWVKTQWDDWTGCYVRIKTDCAVENCEDPSQLVVYDWKTGKFRQEQNASYLEQLSLYAVGAFHTHSHIKTVVPQLAYLDHGILYPPANGPIVYKRKELPVLIKDWERRVKPMFHDTIFAPTPNDNCRWCHYRKTNGGPCQY